MMGSMLGNLPPTPIGVGETATAPLDFAVPLPLPGAGPLKVEGETRIRLVAIDKDNQGRSARFDSTMNGTMVSKIPSPDAQGTMTLDFSVEGDGTVVIDLEKGLPRSAVSTSTISGKLGTPAGGPGMILRGTIKVTMTGK